MLRDPPAKALQYTTALDVREIAPLPPGPAMELPRSPGAMIKLLDGRTMHVREAQLGEAPDSVAKASASLKIPAFVQV
jgi:hypothetical protein